MKKNFFTMYTKQQKDLLNVNLTTLQKLNKIKKFLRL